IHEGQYNDPLTAETYTISLHDALPISNVAKGVSHQQYTITSANKLADFLSNIQEQMQMQMQSMGMGQGMPKPGQGQGDMQLPDIDRKSTRLNSSHVKISYAVFCLKKNL